jgi:predicted enzyme related to lactoylglutathione lyase
VTCARYNYRTLLSRFIARRYGLSVPEGKTVKNRVHLDLIPTARGRDEEVSRLLAIGATLVGDHRRADGSGWVTMADPEGNEFCVERSAQERGQA